MDEFDEVRNVTAKPGRSGDRTMNQAAMRKINESLRNILERAPSDASAHVEILRTNSGYKGLLKIYSHHRRFVGGSKGRSFSGVIDSIFHEVAEQIHQWKEERDSQIDS